MAQLPTEQQQGFWSLEMEARLVPRTSLVTGCRGSEEPCPLMNYKEMQEFMGGES